MGDGEQSHSEILALISRCLETFTHLWTNEFFTWDEQIVNSSHVFLKSSAALYYGQTIQQLFNTILNCIFCLFTEKIKEYIKIATQNLQENIDFRNRGGAAAATTASTTAVAALDLCPPRGELQLWLRRPSQRAVRGGRVLQPVPSGGGAHTSVRIQIQPQGQQVKTIPCVFFSSYK